MPASVMSLPDSDFHETEGLMRPARPRSSLKGHDTTIDDDEATRKTKHAGRLRLDYQTANRRKEFTPYDVIRPVSRRPLVRMASPICTHASLE